ncbi:MAG: BMC domain-containing protein [Phycisphaerae bacterium]
MKQHPALALIEFSSIAAGTRATDALTKKAPVTLIRVGSLQPGKFAVLFAGDVASVDESFVAGLQAGAEFVVDRVLLPNVDEGVYNALVTGVSPWSGDTIGIIETSTLAATIQAADAAVKGASVNVVEIRLGDGLGGKGVAHFCGVQADVEAAIEIGYAAAAADGRSVCTVVIPRIDDGVRAGLAASTCFREEP